MANSEVLRIRKETVSYSTLKDMLPECCYDAVIKNHPNATTPEYEQFLYDSYFNAASEEILTEEEQHQLFEKLGNEWIKSNYSTSQFRQILHFEEKPREEKKRKVEDN